MEVFMAKYGPKPKPMEERFWAKVRKTRGCWWWEGTKNNMGYGTFMRVSPKKELAHRVSWMIANGAIPDGARVLHNCPEGDNPACVNPDHLYLGTMKDNTQDMMKKGRNRYVAHHGEENGFSKLDANVVREIRERWEAGPKGEALQMKLAAEFGVCFSNVGHIVSRRTWKHVE